MEKNDWVASLLYNPDKDYDNFREAGYTSENTFLEPKEKYQENPEVQGLFITEDGEFQQEAFNDFYKEATKSYNNFINDDIVDKHLSNETFSVLNTSTYAQDKKKETPKFSIRHVPNPQGITKGLSGVYETTAPVRSMREAAQTQKIYNTKTGVYEDRTPNDLFSTLFREPVVEARWEEDGTHRDEYGREVNHYKGQWKVNSEGNPYYETLGDRDAINKSFLHISDVLTDDGSFMNSIDFFDSDGLKKSTTGAILKAAAAIAPIFIPGVNVAYGAIGATIGLANVLGVLGTTIDELVYKDGAENQGSWKFYNNLIAFTNRFDNSYSDKDSEGDWNFNKLIGMTSDVAAQLMQQRALGKIPSMLANSEKRAISKYLSQHGDELSQKLGKTVSQALKDGDLKKTMELLPENEIVKLRKALEKQYKVGSNLSAAYMAAVQATDTQQTMKAHDFSEEARAAGLLAATVGYFGLMKTELGQWVLEKSGLDEGTKMIDKGIKQYTQEVALDTAKKVTASSTGKIGVIKDSITKIMTNGKKLLSENSSGILANMAKEGAEEISEELWNDAVISGIKGIEESIAALGGNKSKNTYSWTESNPLERYLLSGVGGALGGAVFAGVDKANAWFAGELNKAKDILPKETLDTFKEAIMLYGEDFVVNEIEKQKSKGTFLPTSLSIEVDTDSSDENALVFKPTTDRKESQNDIAFDHLLGLVKGISNIIKSEDLQLDKDTVVDSALMKQTKLAYLSSNGIDKIIYKDYIELSKKLVDLSISKKAVEAGTAGTVDTDKINTEYNEVKKQLTDLITGNKAADYTERMLFTLSPAIQDAFSDSNIEVFSKHYLGKSYNDLSDKEREQVDKLYADTKANEEKWGKASFKIFKGVKAQAQSTFTEIANDPDFVQFNKQFQDTLAKLNEDQGLTFKISEEEKERTREEFTKDKSLDQVIAENKLNPKELALTEEQKQNLVNNFVDSKVYKAQQEAYQEKVLTNRQKNMSLGINPILTERGEEQLIGLIQALQTFDRLDERSIEMVKKLRNAHSQLDLPTFVNNTIKQISTGDVETAQKVLNNDNRDLFTDSLKALIESKLSRVFPDLGTEEEITKFQNIFGKKVEPTGTAVTSLNEILNDPNIEELSDNISFFFNPDGSATVKFKPTLTEDYEDSFADIDDITIELSSVDVQNLVREAINEDVKSVGGNNSDISNLNKLRTMSTLFKNSPQIQERVGLLNEIDKITSSMYSSPIRKLLTDLSKEFLGEDIFELLNLEEDNYSKLNNLSSYMLANNLRKEKLLQAKKLIDFLKSAIRSSVSNEDAMFDFATVINDALKKSDLPLYQNLTTDQALAMESQLDDITFDIDYLVYLSDVNSASKGAESKKTDIRINSLVTLMFGQNSIFGDIRPKLLYEDSEGNEVDFLDSIRLTEEEYEKIYKIAKEESDTDEDGIYTYTILNRIESEIFEKFATLNEEQQTAVLQSIIEPESWGNKPLIKSDSEWSDLGFKYFQSWFINSVAVKPEIFNATYSEAIKDSKYAPFYLQKIAIRTMFNYSVNPKLFNKVLDLLNGVRTDKDLLTIKNFLFINGDPGSGKTSAVANTYTRMMKLVNPNYKMVGSSVTQERSNNLNKELGLTSMPIDELFDKILTESGKEKYKIIHERTKKGEFLNDQINGVEIVHKLPGDSSYYNLNPNLFTKDDFNTDINAIVFDEITHLSSFERDTISQSGILLLGLGDSKQEGFVFQGADFNAIDNGYYFSTPSLNMSIRSNNLNKKDNLDILTAMLRKINDEISEFTLNGTPTSFNRTKEALSRISLRYYEKNGILQGDKVMEAEEVNEQYLRRIISKLQEGEKIAYITNKDSELGKIFDKLSNEFADKVAIVSSSNVQGSEFKYTVIDINWDAEGEKTFDIDFAKNVKKLYTLITRSSDGSILINHPNLLVNKSTKLTYPSADSTVKEEDVESYKKYVQSQFSGKVVNEEGGEDKIDKESVMPKDNTAPESTSEKKLTIEDRDKLESSIKVIDEEVEGFLSNNLQVISDHNTVGVGYENGDNYEDLSFLGHKPDRDELTALFILKSLFSRESVNNELIDKLFAKRQDNLSKLSPFYEFFAKGKTPVESLELFKEALKNGKYQIKVRNFNQDSDKSINSTYSTKFKGLNNGDKYARMVYSIEIDGKTLDLTLGNINLTKAELNPDLLSRISSMDYGYLPINAPKIVVSSARYRNTITGEKRDVDNFNAEKTPLNKVMSTHPEFHFSSQLYIRPSKTEDGKQEAPVVALTTSDLWNTDNLLDRYINYLSTGNGDSSSPVYTTYVNSIGRGYDKFSEEWSDAINKEEVTAGELNQLCGYMQAPRFIKAIQVTVKALTDKKLPAKTLLAKEEFDKIIADEAKTKELIDSLNSILSKVRATLNAKNAILNRKGKLKNNSDAIIERYLRGDFTGDNLNLGLKDYSNYVRKIAKELSASYDGKDLLLIALRESTSDERLTSTGWSNNKKNTYKDRVEKTIESISQYQESTTIFNSKELLSLLEKNILFGVNHSFSIISEIVRATNIDGDEETRMRNKNAMNLALQVTNTFKDGIWYNPLSLGSEDDYEGYHPSMLTVDQVYIDGPIQLPLMYIDYNSIQPEEDSGEKVESGESTESKIDTTVDSLTIKDNILKSIPETIPLQGNNISTEKIKNLVSKIFDKNPEITLENAVKNLNEEVSNGKYYPSILKVGDNIVASEILSFRINGGTVELVKSSNSIFTDTITQYLEKKGISNSALVSDYDRGVIYTLDNSSGELKVKMFKVSLRGGKYSLVDTRSIPNKFLEYIKKDIEEIKSSEAAPIVKKEELKVSYVEFRNKFLDITKSVSKNTLVGKALQKALENPITYGEIISRFYSSFGSTKVRITSTDKSDIINALKEDKSIQSLVSEITAQLNEIISNSEIDGQLKESVVRSLLVSKFIDIYYNELNCI